MNPADDPMAYAHQLGLCEIDAAKAHSLVFEAERLYRRVRATVLATCSGKTGPERDAQALIEPRVIAAEDDWLGKHYQAQIAGAKRDAMRVKMDVWRTMESTRRSEMARGL